MGLEMAQWPELIERAAAQAELNRGSSHATLEGGSRGRLEEDDSFNNENEPWWIVGVGTLASESKRQVEKRGLILSAALTSWQSI